MRRENHARCLIYQRAGEQLEGVAEAYTPTVYYEPACALTLTRLQFMQSLGAVNLGDVRQEVQDTSAVAPLVVVPADELDEVLVQGDTGLGIEDGRVGVAVQVRGDDIVLSVGKDACSMLS